jgi:hypothetical protein
MRKTTTAFLLGELTKLWVEVFKLFNAFDRYLITYESNDSLIVAKAVLFSKDIENDT